MTEQSPSPIMQPEVITATELQYAQQLLIETKDLVHSHLPQADTGPTRLRVVKNNPGFGAVYIGKINNAQTIILNLSHSHLPYVTKDSFESLVQRKRDQYLLAHELIHQAHAEFVGQEAQGEPEEGMTVDGFDDMDQTALVDFALGLESPRSFAIYILEGVAELGKYHVMKMDEEQLRRTHKTRDAIAATIARRELFRTLRQLMKLIVHATDPATVQNREYAIGPYYIHELLKHYGEDRFAEIISNIDLNECFAIPDPSDLSRRTLNSLRLLPMHRPLE